MDGHGKKQVLRLLVITIVIPALSGDLLLYFPSGRNFFAQLVLGEERGNFFAGT